MDKALEFGGNGIVIFGGGLWQCVVGERRLRVGVQQEVTAVIMQVHQRTQ